MDMVLIPPPLALCAALHIYFYHLLLTQPIYIKCHCHIMRILNKLRRGLQALYVFLHQFLSLLSLSCSLLNLSSLTSSTSLLTLLAIFDIPCVINMLWTVRFPFTVVYTMLVTYTKLEWLVNHIYCSHSLHTQCT